LIAAANVCDEAVGTLGGGSEPRYTCNGQFQLTSGRGEILKNLLTSCAGRVVYAGGQFVIHPGAWEGVALDIG
jgi:predicted phage tail protein